MDSNVAVAPASITSEPAYPIPADSPQLFSLKSLPNAYFVKPGAGRVGVVLLDSDLKSASSSGEVVVPTWSSADLVIERYGLGALVAQATTLAHDVFGAGARIVPGIIDAPDGVTPVFVLTLHVPRAMRHLRSTFLGRYARETEVPAGSPVPGVLWAYENADVST